MNSSLYIHIPFCKKLCGYCDFYKTMSLAKLPQVLVRTAEEMREKAPMLAGTTLKTIYFGGGTPTVCAPEELGALIALAGEIFGTSEVEEVSTKRTLSKIRWKLNAKKDASVAEERTPMM